MQNKSMDGEQLIALLTEKVQSVSIRNELINQIDILLSGMNKIDAVELTDLGKFIADQAKTAKQYEDFLRQARETLLALPVVEITIAFTPTNRESKEIVDEVRAQIFNQAIVDLEVNPHLIGGATISFQGKYYDGSIAAKLAGNTKTI